MIRFSKYFMDGIIIWLRQIQNLEAQYYLLFKFKELKIVCQVTTPLQNEPSHICHVFLRQKLTDGLYCLLRKLCVYNRRIFKTKNLVVLNISWINCTCTHSLIQEENF